MSKDPFQILADELTLIRKDEAQALHQIVAQAVKNMQQATKAAPGEIRATLQADRDQMARSATQAAGEARREAWRYFGGFWVWLASMLATGVVLGLLLAYGTETAK
jgi:hypothetical protein